MRRLPLLAGAIVAAACVSRVEPPPTEVAFQPPRLLNAEEVRAALRGQAGEREARVVLWLYVDTTGYPARIQIRSGTGQPGLDSAAVRVARIMEFDPARRNDRPTPAWVEQALVFVAAPPQPPETRARTEPRLLNDFSVVADLRSAYRGLSGSAQTWVRIAASGRVDDVSVLEASDARAERAARELARGFRFAPARRMRAGAPAGEATEAAAVYRIAFGPAGTVRAEIADLDQAYWPALRSANPYDAPPRLRDPEGARRAVEEGWRKGARPGTAPRGLLWLFVDAEGKVAVVHVRSSTGDPGLDAALREIARGLECEPAERAGARVGAWLELPVSAGD